VSDHITLPRETVEQMRGDLYALVRHADGDCGELDCEECEPIRPIRAAIAVLAVALAEQKPEPRRHPGYVIGSHWLETAYSRICAGDAEADVLRDYGLIREEAFTIGVENLRQENERLKAKRDEAVKAEREACAKLCDQEVDELAYGNDDWYIAKTLAAVIRARGEV